MAAGGVNPNLRIYEDSFMTDKYSNVDRLTQAKLTTSESLSNMAIQLYGQRSDRFPLMLATKAKGNIRTVKSVDTLFTVPIMGKPQKSDAISSTIYSAGQKIGVGKAPITLTFATSHFRKAEFLILRSGAQVVVQTDPVPATGGGFTYTAIIHGNDPTAWIPYSDIAPGVRVAAGWVAAGQKRSQGTHSRAQGPSKMQNQCTKVRASYNWEGNLNNKVMVLEMPVAEGKTTKFWMEYERFDMELRFMEEKETALWESKFNRTADGQILDRDANTGDVLITGSGLKEQIPNEATFSVLTESILSKIVRDVVWNSGSTTKREISLYTGLGGREDFHKAMAAAAKSTGFSYTENQAIGGGANSGDLRYGAYFGSYVHQDGHVITLKNLPLLDYGAVADAAAKHPVTKLPVTSHDMYFIDESMINGQRNLQFIQEEGVQGIVKEIRGMNSTSDVVSSDDMVSSYQYIDSVGIHLMNPVNSFKLRCVAA